MNPFIPGTPQSPQPMAPGEFPVGAPPEAAPPPQPKQPEYVQLTLAPSELQRLESRIRDGVEQARSEHSDRWARFRRYYRQWRGLQTTSGGDKTSKETEKPFQVPMLKWTMLAQWARFMQGLIGSDAEVIARPTAPSDEKKSAKVGKYMSWRLFEYMQAKTALAAWVFRACLWGRAHAEVKFIHEYYWELDDQGQRKEVLSYCAPRITALWPEELVLPALDVDSEADYPWKLKREWITPQALLDGERRGRYTGITANWQAIITEAARGPKRDWENDYTKLESDQAEGVAPGSALATGGSTLEIWRWYGKYRMPLNADDAAYSDVDDITKRQPYESDLCVSYLSGPQLTVGIEDMINLYPRMKKRDPFLSIATMKDGSYWCPGLGELVEDLQNEASVNFKQFRDQGQLSVGPIIFYKASSGFDPDTFTYKPKMTIPSEDPAGVRVVQIPADFTYIENMNRWLGSMNEKTTGVTDNTLGRASDRPNAPRTASGQAMLLEESNTRVALDLEMLREDFSKLLDYIWQLDAEYADEDVYFRVAEDDAPFDLDHGFGKMTADERENMWGFDLKLATSAWSKEARKQAMLQVYQLTIANPVVQTNPRALWVILKKVWDSFEMGDFATVVPEPPMPEAPKTPKQEWAQMLKGEETIVSPLDDDDAHIEDHRHRLELEMQNPPEKRDAGLEKGVAQHIMAHEQQKRQKMLLQVLAQAAVKQMQASGLVPQGMGLTPEPSPTGPQSVFGGGEDEQVPPPQPANGAAAAIPPRQPSPMQTGGLPQ